MDEPVLLFERSGVLAVAKPAGLATQAPPGIDSVEAWVRRAHAGSTGYVGVPHRLDRAVSGVMLLAATPRAARVLSRQFERRQVRKTYLAIVEGDPTADATIAAEWHDHVMKVDGQPRATVVPPDATGGREAVTRPRLLARLDAVAGRDRLLLELEPCTGRMHQLRVQAAARGLPILGDILYGGIASDSGWSPPQAGLREPPIALHAWRIRFADPDGGQPVVAEAPLPTYWPAATHCAIQGAVQGFQEG